MIEQYIINHLEDLFIILKLVNGKLADSKFIIVITQLLYPVYILFFRGNILIYEQNQLVMRGGTLP